MTNFTGKQRAFIDHYLRTLNGTEAARLAGYTGNANALGVVAHQNLRKSKIKNEIDRRMRELTMSANEVIYRLHDHATASLESFVHFDGQGNFWVDLDKARDAGLLHLAKEIKQNKTIYTDKDGNSETTYRTEIKIHDSQAALEKLGRYYKLFVTRQEVTGADGGPVPIAIVNVDMSKMQ